MGRIVSLGIQSNMAANVMGVVAERPLAANPGVTFFNQTSNQLEIWNGSAWHPVNDYQRIDISTSGPVLSNRSYWVNTASASVTLTLPASPTSGDFIKVTDVTGTFGTNNCTINPNGNRIMRQADTMTISTNGASVRMV
jgi:hypothetical protein